MDKERKDKIRGATYGAGIALSSWVPEEVRKKENETKKLLKCKCNLFGCYACGYKQQQAKNANIIHL